MEELVRGITEMLESERKRRQYAIQFLEKLSNMIQEACLAMYGEEGNDPYINTSAVWIYTKEKRNTHIYYRYKKEYIKQDIEDIGFYYAYPMRQDVCWSVPVKDLKGKEFWRAISAIITWLPELAETITKRSASRDKLVEKLKRLSE